MKGELTEEEKMVQLGEKYDQDPHVRMAQIGIELQAVMGTKVGKALEEKAQNQIDEAVSLLLTLDMGDNPARFREVRLEALVAQQALSWIHEIITDGQNAEDQLNRQDYIE